MTEPAAASIEAAAASAASSIERHLHVVAAMSEIGSDIVLVGGAAVNVHTGSYRPTDIDVVGRVGTAAADRLAAIGFERLGRHWLITMPDGETIAIEVVGSALFPAAEAAPELIEVGEVVVRVIALDDLVVDRILQATDETPVTRDEAIRLAVAAYERINWSRLERRVPRIARVSGVPVDIVADTLRLVRRAAIQGRRSS